MVLYTIPKKSEGNKMEMKTVKCRNCNFVFDVGVDYTNEQIYEREEKLSAENKRLKADIAECATLQKDIARIQKDLEHCKSVLSVLRKLLDLAEV